MAKKFLIVDTDGNYEETQAEGEDVNINDIGGYYTDTDLENILQEIGSKLSSSIDSGVDYTASGAITKGDLVYISADDAVSVYSDITTFEVGIGIALNSAADGETVKVLRNDTTIDGFTGLTAGTKYFWDGSGVTTNLNTFTSGDYVYVLGVAKNPTTAHVEVQFLYKKS